MRTYLKSETIDLCQSMQDLHYQISILNDLEKQRSFLMVCKEAILSIENSISVYNNKYEYMLDSMPIYSDSNVEVINRTSEKYKVIAEVVELYSQAVDILLSQNTITTEELDIINDLAYELQKRIEDISNTYQVIFFPYNASMWDSLESIWLACRADPNCECLVVPIPYHVANRITGQWEPHYDGYKFPEEVPITHYSEFDLEKYNPDLVYIHNPYDEYNHITRIDPEYYSGEIKKHTKKLVYVPYYVVTGESASAEQSDMPAYANMDYMILKSEENKKYFEGRHFYDKLVVLGSPKFDRMITMQEDYVEIPEEWEDIIGSKKVIFLNTTVSSVLKFRSKVLSKLREVFDRAKDNKDVVLIWRPHPLLESTFTSMATNLYNEYKELVEYFQDNEIGILDDTSDINKTISICDAYIGCITSSVVNLFQIVNKPIYALNYEIGIEHLSGFPYINLGFELSNLNNECFASRTGMLLKLNKNSMNFEIEKEVPTVKNITSKTIRVLSHLSYGKSYVITSEDVSTPRYDLDNKTIYISENMFKEKYPVFLLEWDTKIIIIQNASGNMSILDTITNEYINFDGCLSCFGENVGYRPTVSENNLIITSPNKGIVFNFDLETNEFNTINIEGLNCDWCLPILENSTIYLSDINGTIVSCDILGNNITRYELPNELITWEYSEKPAITRVHMSIHKHGKFLITLPCCSDSATILNLNTGVVSSFAKEVYEIYKERVDNKLCMPIVCNVLKLDDDNILIVDNHSGVLCKSCLSSNISSKVEIELSEELILKCLSNQPLSKRGFGNVISRFEVSGLHTGIFMREVAESDLTFIHDQIREFNKVLGVNLDGTCGEKVHDFMMNCLEEENN